MVEDAEKFKAEDEVATQRTQSKNHLESYCYSLRNTLQDQKFAGKLDSKDKSTVETAVTEAIKWMESNANAPKEAIESKQKALESTCNPIIAKVYQGAGGAGGPGGMDDGGGMPTGGGGGDSGSSSSGGASDSGSSKPSSGPKVEEVD